MHDDETAAAERTASKMLEMAWLHKSQFWHFYMLDGARTILRLIKQEARVKGPGYQVCYSCKGMGVGCERCGGYGMVAAPRESPVPLQPEQQMPPPKVIKRHPVLPTPKTTGLFALPEKPIQRRPTK